MRARLKDDSTTVDVPVISLAALTYGEAGVPGVIPPNARLTVEIKVLDSGSKG